MAPSRGHLQYPALWAGIFIFDQGVDGLLPGALGQGVVGGREKRLGHLQAEGGLAHGLVLRQDELGSLVGVLGAEALASAGLGIDAVEGASAESTLNEPEPVFHNIYERTGK